MFRSKYLNESYLADEGLTKYDCLNDQQQHYCKFCGKACDITVVDEGYDGYEYGSFVGTHHDYHTVSVCCGYDVGLIPEIDED